MRCWISSKPSALIVLLLAGLLAAACAASPKGDLRKIRVPMGYIPSVQYAAFYMAEDRGYFAAEGLEVELDYSLETSGVQLVGANEIPFSVASGEQVLLARAQGLPVVYVMAWFQKFPVAVTSHASAGIQTPADLRGRRIGVPTLDGASFIGLRALLAQAGIPPEEVRLQVVGFNQAAALEAGQVDAIVVYANNEPIRLAAQGQELNTLLVSDYATLASNGIITNEATLTSEPELVRGFARALSRGIRDCLANPDEAYRIAKPHVPTITDDALEKRVLAATLALWQAEHIGESHLEAWENMQATLLDARLLAKPVDLSQAFTNEFIP